MIFAAVFVHAQINELVPGLRRAAQDIQALGRTSQIPCTLSPQILSLSVDPRLLALRNSPAKRAGLNTNPPNEPQAFHLDPFSSPALSP